MPNTPRLKIVLSIFILFLFFKSPLLKAQEPVFINYTADDGLQGSEVYDVLQDKKGFIWLGTSEGLVKYNGQQFKLYQHVNRKSSSISGLRMTDDGVIWCHNFSGQVFYFTNDSLHLLNSWNSRITRSFPSIENYKNSIILSSDKGFYTYTLSTNKWDSIKLSNFVIDVVALKNTFYAYDFADFFHTINATNKRAAKQSIKTSFGTPHHLFKCGNKTLVVDESNEQILEHNVSRNIFSKICSYTGKGKIHNISHALGKAFISTTKGLYYIDNGVMAPYLLDKNISKVIEDNEGALWLTSLTEGLFYIPNVNALNCNSSIALGKNEKFTHLNSAINLLFASTNQGHVYKIATDKMELVFTAPNFSNVEGLKYNEKLKTLFISAGGLNSYNIETKKITSSPLLTAIKDFCFVDDSVWIASSFGCGILAIEKLLDTKPNIRWLNRTRCRKVELDKKTNRLYCLNQEGLIIYNLLSNKDIATNEIKNLKIIDFAFNGDDQIFVTTTNQEIIKISTNLKVSQIKGFKAQGIHFISNDLIALNYKNSFVVLNCKNYSANTISKSEGHLSGDIYTAAKFNERIFVAGNKGLISLPLNSKQKSVAPCFFSSIKKDAVELSYNNSALNIFVESGNNFKSLGNDVLKYRFINRDTNWIVSNNKQQISFNALPNGTNNLQVVIQSSKGILSNVIEIPIIVESPFYQKIWFYSLCFITMLGATFLIYRKRVAIVEAKAAKALYQQKLESDLRLSLLTSLKAQMNPHFIFNALNSIQSFVFQNDKFTANKYLGKFADLMRMVLNMSNEASVRLSDEIKALKLYLDLESLQLNDFSYEIKINDHVDVNSIKIPSLLIQPYVENSLKHGLIHKNGLKTLLIEIIELPNSNCLTITVTDNGIGREAAAQLNTNRIKEHKSFATAANQKRLTLLNNMSEELIVVEFIDNFSGAISTGTTVILKIPLSS